LYKLLVWDDIEREVILLSKYYSIHEFSKIIGVSAQTLRNWDSNGKLHPHHTTASGCSRIDTGGRNRW